jgi:hypothetical protein
MLPQGQVTRLLGRNECMSQSTIQGKITAHEERVAQALKWLPWLSFFGAALPLPVLFLVLFFGAAATETAAFYFFLSVLSAALGVGAGLTLVLVLLLYRKRWMQRLRDRLAVDGITASEVRWFMPELTTAERKALAQISERSELLADAYSETLAARLMATRLINRTKQDLLLVERRLNRVILIQGADTNTLQRELQTDRAKLASTRQEAAARLAEAQARLQTIEAAASRNLSHGESYLMMQRLSAAQEHLPLSMEMAKLEQQALEEAQHDVRDRTVS